MMGSTSDTTIVVPAKAGIHFSAVRATDRWIPAFIGMTMGRGQRLRATLHSFIVLLVLIMATAPAYAVRPDEMLADPRLEARAREVGRDLRCLVCRNQSIDDSDADLAHDLRVLVRERIMAGDSNDQVIGFVRARYGDFVLLRPPFEVGTALLWGGPLLVLLLGGIAIRRFYRAQAGTPPPPPLSAEERQRLAAALADGESPEVPR
jgi:cytochrome c-type biogenesis protein CcmH